ncbi:MAG TPA: hypothetical protein VKT73_16715 [Xanthobacteraceae bacterium]|nr:hypothetical protein [Xanthobacteraceae bacterium]
MAALVLCSICSITSAVAQGMRNLSIRVHWTYWRDEQFGGQNICEFPVEVRFVSQFDPNAISKILPTGGILITDLKKQQLESGWWISTTCPINIQNGTPFKPSLALVPENKDKIKAGDYECIGE